MNQDIHGLWPALLIPLTADARVDSARAIAHAKRMLAAGCDGVTLFGTTGEGPAFSVAERKALLEALLASGVQGDVQVCVALESDKVAIGLGLESTGSQIQTDGVNVAGGGQR